MAAARPIKLLQFERCEHTSDCMREQLEELIERVSEGHAPDCGCRVCYRYEVISQILLELFETQDPDA